jgi:hypothetical protein
MEGLRDCTEYACDLCSKMQNEISETYKSVAIPAYRQAGVIQTSCDIVKAHGGEIK